MTVIHQLINYILSSASKIEAGKRQSIMSFILNKEGSSDRRSEEFGLRANRPSVKRVGRPTHRSKQRIKDLHTTECNSTG